jgi:hypothetical protein
MALCFGPDAVPPMFPDFRPAAPDMGTTCGFGTAFACSNPLFPDQRPMPGQNGGGIGPSWTWPSAAPGVAGSPAWQPQPQQQHLLGPGGVGPQWTWGSGGPSGSHAYESADKSGAAFGMYLRSGSAGGPLTSLAAVGDGGGSSTQLGPGGTQQMYGPGGTQQMYGPGGTQQQMYGPGGTQQMWGPGGMQQHQVESAGIAGSGGVFRTTGGLPTLLADVVQNLKGGKMGKKTNKSKGSVPAPAPATMYVPSPAPAPSSGMCLGCGGHGGQRHLSETAYAAGDGGLYTMGHVRTLLASR